MSDLIREPDELWTSYLIRRLEREGMNFTRHSDPPYSAVGGKVTEDEVSIELFRSFNEDIFKSLFVPSTHQDLSRLVEISIREGLWIIDGQGNGTRCVFNSDGKAEFERNTPPGTGSPLDKYHERKIYPIEPVIEDIVQYVKDLKPASGFPLLKEEKKITEREQPFESKKDSPDRNIGRSSIQDDSRLDQILSTVRRLERIAAEHPLVLKGEDAYLRKLYVDSINGDINNLQTLEYKAQRIPYVLVDSSEIEGNVGKPYLNLYFVARDLAPEQWQQQIVALHESFCVKKGHEYAKGQESKLATALQKEQEYNQWRKGIDTKVK